MDCTGGWCAGSVSIGNSYASGTDSFAAVIDNNTSSYGATGTNSIAIGYNAKSHTGSRGTAIGYQANVGGNHASAYGHQANAGGAGANAVGYGSNASGNFGSAVGYAAKASGSDAVALGQSNSSGDHSFSAVLASTSTSFGARGDYSIAMGYQSDTGASAQGAVAIGFEASATGNYGVSLGRSVSSGADAVALGIANASSSYGALSGYSIAMGQYAKTSSTEAIALGPSTQATANAAVSIGAFSDATAQRGFALGNYAKAGSIGKFAFSNQRYASVGDTQGGLYVLRQQTTNATPIALTTASGGTPSSTQIILPSGSAYAFTGTIVAKQLSSSNAAAWEVKGLIVNQGGTTTLTNSATTVISNTPSWGMALSADDTNDALAITVTGAASTTIRWVANIQTSEVSIA